MAEQEGAGVRYSAFLSYSHRDASAARRLHRKLETYRLPKRLVGQETARGPVPERLWPIFRDREELPAATDLSETVRQALAQSGALIIVCSPNSAGSLWVAEEIETFRRLNPDRPILAAILEGDPPDCFPPALRAYGQDGTWHEPLATDLRRHRDGPKLGLLKLVAGVTGVGLDALVQRDAQRKIRRVTSVTAAALTAMVAMVALTVVAVQAGREADRQRSAAEGQIEFMLTDLRSALRGVGRLDIMQAVNRRAIAYYGGQRELDRLPPASLERRARILLAMGEDYLAQDHFSAALAAFREAHRTTAEQLRREPLQANRIWAHSQSEYWVGYSSYRRRDFSSAGSAWGRYRDLTRRLVTIDPHNAEWIREAGYAEGNLCTISLERPETRPTALGSCLAALRHMEQVQRVRGDQPQALVDLANRHGWLINAWDANGRWDRALDHRRRQRALIERLISSDPSNMDYRDIWARAQLGFAQRLLSRRSFDDALQILRDAAETLRIVRQRDPGNAEWRRLERDILEATAQASRRGA